MKDAKCLECGAESNSLLEIMHADWCPVPNRPHPSDSMKALEKRLDAIEKVWKSLDQRLAKLEWKSTLHEGKSVVVGHMDMATGKVEPTEAGNALMADSAGKVRLTPNQYLYGVLWRRGDFDHAEMRKEVLEAIGGKGSKAQHDAIEWACSVMEPPDDFDVWTLDEAANVGPPPATQAAVDDYNAKLYAGLGSWREGDKIHTPECAMSKSAGVEPCDCWHSKVEQNIREARADQLKRDMENAIKVNRNTGYIPPAKPSARETLVDALEQIGERNADKALDASTPDIGLNRYANHVEDTLVSPIASGEAKIMSAADKYWGGEAPKKRKRKWWRLGL